MKQKRTFVTLLLIVGLLCLGIGYAAITGIDLNITGNVSATVAEGAVDVKFTAAEVTAEPTGSTVTAEIDSSDATGRTGTIGVSGLTKAGDTATVEFTIGNQSDTIPATLAKTLTYDNTKWFTVTAELSEEAIAKKGEEGDSQTLTVTVTLNETVINSTDEQAATDEITIHIDAEPSGNN